MKYNNKSIKTQYLLLAIFHLSFTSFIYCSRVAIRETAIDRVTVQTDNLQIAAGKFAQEQGLEQIKIDTSNNTNLAVIQQIKTKCRYLIAQCEIAIDNAYLTYDNARRKGYGFATTDHSNTEYQNHTLPKKISFDQYILMRIACIELIQAIDNLSEQEFTKQWQTIEDTYKKIEKKAYMCRYDRDFIRYDQRIPQFSVSEIEKNMLLRLMFDVEPSTVDQQLKIIRNEKFQALFINKIRKPDKDFKDTFSPYQHEAVLEAVNATIDHQKMIRLIVPCVL